MRFFENIARLLQTPDTLSSQRVYTSPKSLVVVGSLLGVTEFEVFRIAYCQWYGVSGSREDIEKIYTRYIFDQAMPHWVRHFCQKIQRLQQSGELKARDFTGHPDRRPGMSKNILLA